MHVLILAKFYHQQIIHFVVWLRTNPCIMISDYTCNTVLEKSHQN